MIELKDIEVIFKKGDRQIAAVSDVNLKIEAGEIYGIVGYSGAGKSTLVRTINLLQRPTSGQVLIQGTDLTQLAPSSLRQARKKIGMIFQHFNLMESRTVKDNVAFPLKDSPLSSQQKEEKVISLLQRVGIADKANQYPQQLSGGQKQRVAIARALANDPDILLCDEATSALDPKTTLSILDLLQQLNKELGLTIVLITHEMNVVKSVCERVAVMEQGRIIEQGSILNVFTHAQDPLTREFINTATHFDRELELVIARLRENDEFKGQKLVRLSYVGRDTTQPLIARLAQQYQVQCNILYGNIEVLQGSPVGNLLVSVEASEADWQRAVQYLEGLKIKVELLKEGEVLATATN